MPVGPSPFAPVGTASPDRSEQWRAREANLVDCLVRVSKGNAAGALARHYWPFLWDGEKAKPPRLTDDQRVAQANAPREAVKRWLSIHGRQLEWRLELAASSQQLDRDTHHTADEVRSAIRANGKAHVRIAEYLRAFEVNSSDEILLERAKQAIRRLYAAEDQVSDFFARIALYKVSDLAEECERVARETTEWLDERPARGRSGKNLAAIEIAYLVATYFDMASAAANAINDHETVLDLKVKLSRKPVKEQRRDIADDVINYLPDNSYCCAVAAAIGDMGVSSQVVGDNGWRSAVEAVCAERKLLGSRLR
jgi:hypothetical protein